MNDTTDSAKLTPFEVLADYEKRSLAHSAGTPEQAQVSGTWRGIGFRLGDRFLVSSLGEVNEILALGQVAHVPGTQTWLLGVTSVRGNLVPLIDLKQFLMTTPSVVDEMSRVLVVRQQGGSVGLLVDEVLGQRSFASEQRVDARPAENDVCAPFVSQHYLVNGTDWTQFSMATLVRTQEFLQAAA